MPLICDFCSAPNPQWAYPATDAPLPDPLGVSIGSWCACDQCAALIEANAPAQLAARSAETYSRVYGTPIPAEMFEDLQYHCFWTHLTGPRRPAHLEVN
jgi:hypothetical protein